MDEEKIGYQFVGWYIDKELTKRLNPGGILPHTVTLYDKWIPIYYPIKYECYEGMNARRNPSFLCIESEELTLYPAKKKGFMFVGWKWKGQLVSTLPAGLHEPVDLEAEYKELPLISFDTNGGGNFTTISTDEDGFIHDLKAPKRIGYAFDGWYWDSDYHWRYDFDEPIYESCTLYAKWKIQEYHIRYDVQGGFSSRRNPKSYTYFDGIDGFLPAKKKGYVFDGWYDEYDNLINNIPDHSLGDKLLIARYHVET